MTSMRLLVTIARVTIARDSIKLHTLERSTVYRVLPRIEKQTTVPLKILQVPSCILFTLRISRSRSNESFANASDRARIRFGITTASRRRDTRYTRKRGA